MTFYLRHIPNYLANEPIHANTDLAVTNKYTGEVACRVARADEAVIDQAIGAAVNAAEVVRKMPAFARQVRASGSPWKK